MIEQRGKSLVDSIIRSFSARVFFGTVDEQKAYREGFLAAMDAIAPLVADKRVEIALVEFADALDESSRA